MAGHLDRWELGCWSLAASHWLPSPNLGQHRLKTLSRAQVFRAGDCGDETGFKGTVFSYLATSSGLTAQGLQLSVNVKDNYRRVLPEIMGLCSD